MNYSVPEADLELYGLGAPVVGLLPEAQEAFERLQRRAAAAGIDLAIASAHRDFARQLSLWNRKVAGQLPVLDDGGQPLAWGGLADRDKMFAILRWSALPGASRHHWGSDCDVYDKAALAPGEALQLTQAEARGKFARLHRWLDEHMAAGDAEGFYRPYDAERGGIAPEPWHLSYAPLAALREQHFSLEQLGAILAQSDISLKETVLANLAEIHRRFIRLPPRT